MDNKKLRFLIIDDSKTILMTYTLLLEQAGYEVIALSSCDQAIETILKEQPDVVLCDLMLPGLDGIEFFKKIRSETDIKQPVFIVISGKQFDYDRRRAKEAGVDAYLTKPINEATFVEEILSHVECKMTIRFWGVRGTLPVPGSKSIKYGGNTNCISLNIANKQNFIFDAGSGIKELSNYILREELIPYKAKIFISHPHYDHINGIPFFVPLYMKGNEFEFLGSDQGSVTLEKCLSDQMDSVYFPVTMNEFSSTVSFHSLNEETIMIEDIQVDTILLNHPGRCIGFKITYKGKVFSYITDNEIYLKNDTQRYNKDEVDRLISFIRDSDVLVIDATYTDAEYPRKVGWGHSPLSMVIEVADLAHVKLLCLHHHDPDQTDDDIDKKLETAKKLLTDRKSATIVVIPKEGDEIVF
ncbi:MAG TPA: response regulator [Gammaproteobacteria bacterium]|jgi:phosphoribosyl 1,2-cyclic phosphodiesterase/ActR/RegA family two-component response regulator|nr:response regulator [Gammaproteobacteria bacterium]